MTDQHPSWRDLYLPRKTDLFALVRHSAITVDDATAAIGPPRRLTRRHILECVGGVALGVFIAATLGGVLLLASQPVLAAIVLVGTFLTTASTIWWILSRPSRSRNTPDLLLIERTTRSVLSSMVDHIDAGDTVHEIWTIRGWLRSGKTTPLQQLQIVHQRDGAMYRTAVLTDSPLHARAKRLAEAIGVPHRDYNLGRAGSPKDREWEQFLMTKPPAGTGAS